jgi:hypothetical protein
VLLLVLFLLHLLLLFLPQLLLLFLPQLLLLFLLLMLLLHLVPTQAASSPSRCYQLVPPPLVPSALQHPLPFPPQQQPG